MNRRKFAKNTLMASAIFSTLSALGLSKSSEPAEMNGSLTFKPLFNGKDLTGFVDVNTSKDTWRVEEGVIKCTGQPIGVMRTQEQFENFILEIEWKHLAAGGNSGIFILADGTPFEDKPFPTGMEVQMLSPEIYEIRGYDEEYKQYAHGQLFPVMGMKETIPDHPFIKNPSRSNPLDWRVKEKGHWNKYTVVCVDGTIKLAVNGKFVNGIRSLERKKGYICLESEGTEVHFRNINIMKLPDGKLTPDQVAPVVN